MLEKQTLPGPAEVALAHVAGHKVSASAILAVLSRAVVDVGAAVDSGEPCIASALVAAHLFRASV
jgi:hypothetical protein